MTHPHPRTGAATALGIAASLLLAACSSSSPTHANTPIAHSNNSATSSSPADPTSTTGTPVGAISAAAPTGGTNACLLVTEQEAAAALGADPGPGQDVTAHGASSCMYGTSPLIVTVNLLPTGGKAAYDHARGLAPAGHLVDVTDVGAAAFGVSPAQQLTSGSTEATPWSLSASSPAGQQRHPKTKPPSWPRRPQAESERPATMPPHWHCIWQPHEQPHWDAVRC
jgi:hypothetical protein